MRQHYALLRPSRRVLIVFVVVVVVVVLLAGVLALLWRESLLLTNPPGYKHPRELGFEYQMTPLSVHQLAYEEMEVATPSGGSVRGWLVPSPEATRNLAVVAIHGRAGDRTNHLNQAPVFHSAGAAVALVDLRENGLSDGHGRGTALAMREAEDALSVAADLRRRGYRKIVLYGCSLGASAALIAAASEPDIAGVIADSPIDSFAAYVRDNTEARLRGRGLQGAGWIASAWGEMVVGLTRVRLGMDRLEHPIDVVADIAPRPVLIIHGLDDAVVPVAHSQRLAERAGSNAVLVTIPGANHCNSFDVSPEEFTSRVHSMLALASSG